MGVRETSLLAYMDITPELGNLQLRVLNVLRSLHRATNSMIAHTGSIPINVVTPRVYELRQLGWVEEAYIDKCKQTGKKAIYWRVKR